VIRFFAAARLLAALARERPDLTELSALSR
jgi:hypothetical protein